MLFRFLAISVFLFLFPTARAADDIPPEQVEFFENRIRPVLVEHCYECHSSGGDSEGGLVLDHRAGLQKGGDQGPALGRSARESLLVRVLRHEVPGVEMPEGGSKLSAKIISDFERWIELGAPDPRDQPPTKMEVDAATSWEAIREKRSRWWSFQPIEDPIPPATAEALAWSSEPVDRFIFSSMQDVGLVPNAPASPATLVRRLYFGLVGLPPPSDVVEDFAADPTDAAYEQLVDRLLDSNRFGEKWARHWMDWIRYAESHGSEGDPRIAGAHHYRDYLIRAWNTDVPYDQLVREHIAGDLLESPRRHPDTEHNESLIGTAHWRMVFHGFAPTDALDEKVRFTDDAVNAISKAFLGLTISCARCHDHKFDAISQRDYYALYGVVASCRPGREAIESPAMLVPNRDHMTKTKSTIRRLLADHWLKLLEVRGQPDRYPFEQSAFNQFLFGRNDKEGDERLVNLKNDWARFAAWQQELEASEPSIAWNLGEPTDYQKWFRSGAGLLLAPSAAGEFALHETGPQIIRGVYPACAVTHTLSNKLGGRLASPDFRLEGKQQLWLQLCGEGAAMSRYVVQDYPRNGTVYPVTDLSNNKFRDWTWQIYDVNYWDGDDIHVELATANDAPLLVKNVDRSWFGLRRVRMVPLGTEVYRGRDLEYLGPVLAETDNRLPNDMALLKSAIVSALVKAIQGWRDGAMSDAEARLIDQALSSGLLPNTTEKDEELSSLVAQWREAESQVRVATRVPTLAEWHGRDFPLYERGDHRSPGEIVPRRFLETFGSEPYNTATSGRTKLAEDLLAPDNPFTARVIVNRLWHHTFGQGLVTTPDNFGRLGVMPSHPQLIDYLASRFRSEDKWSLKRMIKRLVMTKTFRQSSNVEPKADSIDPDNKWLSRASVRRLEAEAIRDSMLVASGTLDEKMFGASVRSNEPRRSVYVSVIRNSLDPFLTAFDSPVPFSAVGRRSVTNVPAQSLLLLNGPFAHDMAKAAASRSEHAGDQRERIEQLWMNMLSRQPVAPERKLATEFLESRMERYRQIVSKRENVLERQADVDRALSRFLALARERSTNAGGAPLPVGPSPQATWRFDDEKSEPLVGELRLRGTARLEDGALVLDGGGWAEVGELPFDLHEKTFEVLVQPSDLNQRGGGVFTIQTTDGNVFDGLVFGERAPAEWSVGSDHFRRTKDLNGNQETVLEEAIHLVLTYDREGQICCYRNGQPYGSPYTTSTARFVRSDSQLLWGMRHGKNKQSGRMFRGLILEARLYDRSLSEEEVIAAYGASGLVGRDKLLEALTESERVRFRQLEKQRRQLSARREEIEQIYIPTDSIDQRALSDLAHSILNMKEFIYVR